MVAKINPFPPGHRAGIHGREAVVVTVDGTCLVLAEIPLGRAVMAIHGHGQAEPCVGRRDDYHHAFALRLAQAGHLVLCPELRGFGALGGMAQSDKGHWLDYWRSRRGQQFTLVTDAFL